MTTETESATGRGHCRLFVTYSGIRLPLKLSSPIEDTAHRNTYFRGWFDAGERVTEIEKLVYGEVEMRHRYAYHANGVLAQAEITDADGEIRVLHFDAQGAPLASDDDDDDDE